MAGPGSGRKGTRSQKIRKRPKATGGTEGPPEMGTIGPEIPPQGTPPNHASNATTTSPGQPNGALGSGRQTSPTDRETPRIPRDGGGTEETQLSHRRPPSPEEYQPCPSRQVTNPQASPAEEASEIVDEAGGSQESYQEEQAFGASQAEAEGTRNEPAKDQTIFPHNKSNIREARKPHFSPLSG